MIGLNPSRFSSGLGGLVALVGTEVQVEIADKGHLLATLNGELVAANDVAATDADDCEEILLSVGDDCVLLRRQACVDVQTWPRTLVFDQGDIRISICKLATNDRTGR